jgi:hypothetical protein
VPDFLPQSLEIKTIQEVVVMKKIIPALSVALLFAALSFGATAPDLSDKILVMYKLSAAQETQYDPASTTLSAFW